MGVSKCSVCSCGGSREREARGCCALIRCLRVLRLPPNLSESSGHTSDLGGGIGRGRTRRGAVGMVQHRPELPKEKKQKQDTCSTQRPGESAQKAAPKRRTTTATAVRAPCVGRARAIRVGCVRGAAPTAVAEAGSPGGICVEFPAAVVAEAHLLCCVDAVGAAGSDAGCVVGRGTRRLEFARYHLGQQPAPFSLVRSCADCAREWSTGPGPPARLHSAPFRDRPRRKETAPVYVHKYGRHGGLHIPGTLRAELRKLTAAES